MSVDKVGELVVDRGSLTAPRMTRTAVSLASQKYSYLALAAAVSPLAPVRMRTVPPWSSVPGVIARGAADLGDRLGRLVRFALV